MRHVQRLLAATATVAAVISGGCVTGQEPTCASSCPMGCCDVTGRCVAGTGEQACGGGGAPCVLCAPGQVCREGQCVARCSTSCSGCCDAQGTCHQSTSTACGLGGVSCVACVAGTVCQGGQCIDQVATCGPSTCAGCCQGNDCVEPGDASEACGRGGTLCARCAAAQECTGGRCVDDPCAACAAEDKCCFEGKCFPGNTFGLCGLGGAACKSCDPGQTCNQRACVQVACDPELCPTGCCKDNKCHLPGPADPQACGAGGVTCTKCPDGQICKEGKCEDPPTACDPAQCNGCCDADGKCVTGSSDTACGSGGDCVSCGSSQDCVAGKCTCTTQSCSGCCDGDVCKSGTANDACGAGGQACKKCTGADSCSAGACAAGCTADSCTTGCCAGATCNQGGASDDAACGIGGKPCAPCDTAANEHCTDGVCNNPIACGPGGADPCASGCCAGGQCQMGTTDAACGFGGGICETCPSWWAYCYVGTADHFCDASDGSLWKVTLAKVELDPSVSWDTGSDPDVFVELTVGTQTKSSSTVTGYSAKFDEYLLTATGKDLKAALTFVVYDDDTWPWPNQEIISCTEVIYPDEFARGYAEIPFPCASASNSPVLSIRFDLALETPGP